MGLDFTSELWCFYDMDFEMPMTSGLSQPYKEEGRVLIAELVKDWVLPHDASPEVKPTTPCHSELICPVPGP